MKYASAEALRDALEARLGERARKGESIGRLRKQVAFERLLRRLQQVAPDVWLLKGGFALDLRLAEKLHAYTRRYAGNRPSSRVKDLVDIVLIAGIARFKARGLDDAIGRLFQARGTHERPLAVPSPPRAWSGPYAALAKDVGLPQGLDAAYAEATAFLDPVLVGKAEGGWDPDTTRWRSGP